MVAAVLTLALFFGLKPLQKVINQKKAVEAGAANVDDIE